MADIADAEAGEIGLNGLPVFPELVYQRGVDEIDSMVWTASATIPAVCNS